VPRMKVAVLSRLRTAVAVVGLSSVAILAMPVLPSAAAPTQRAAITAVTTTPARPSLHDPVTVHIAFCIPQGSAEGDTFSLTLPRQLEPLTAGFKVTDATTDIVAQAVVNSEVVTFTMTAYAGSHAGICGTAYFQTILVPSNVTPNTANTLAFAAGGQVFDTTVTPIRTSVPSPEQPLLYGTWAIPALEDHLSGTDALTWYVQAPASPHPDGLAAVTFVDKAGAGQHIDCAHVGVQAGTLDSGGLFTYVSRYLTIKSFSCTRERVRLVTGHIAKGQDLRMVVTTTVADRASASFGSSATVMVDHDKALVVAAPHVTRASAGGEASGALGVPDSESLSPVPSVEASVATTSSSSDFAGKAAIWLAVVVVVLLALFGLAMRRRGGRS
jgi:hypothetical protein